MSTVASGSPKASKAFHIASLDGIRACAFLLVFMGHAGVPGIPAGFGVTVFFFLSGYLITTLLRLELQRSGSISFKLFYLRRTLRILPPFYLVLLAALAVGSSPLLPSRLEFMPVLSQALHFSNYWGALRGFDGTVPGTAVYWSLAVEEHFYALFPALYFSLARAKLSAQRQWLVFVGICALVLIWRCVLVFHLHVSTVRTFMTTDARLDSLLFGCALAVFGNPALETRDDHPSSKWLAILVAAAGLLLVSFVVRSDSFRETIRYTLQGVALYPLFYCAVRFPEWGLFRLLNTRILSFLGKLSYGLYLVHATILLVLEAHFEKILGPYTRALLGFTISLTVAWLLWTVVEKPAARLRKRLEH